MANTIKGNIIGGNVIRGNVIGNIASNLDIPIPPHGEPPEGALKDVNGKFIVDRRGKYIVTTEI